MDVQVRIDSLRLEGRYFTDCLNDAGEHYFVRELSVLFSVAAPA